MYNALIYVSLLFNWIFQRRSLPFSIASSSTQLSLSILFLSFLSSVLSRVQDSSKSGCSRISDKTLLISLPSSSSPSPLPSPSLSMVSPLSSSFSSIQAMNYFQFLQLYSFRIFCWSLPQCQEAGERSLGWTYEAGGFGFDYSCLRSLWFYSYSSLKFYASSTRSALLFDHFGSPCMLQLKFNSKIQTNININQAESEQYLMLMTLFKWQARILNKLYRTQRYDKLTQLQLTSPDQINYSYFFDITPGVNAAHFAKIIEATNKLCRPGTRANVMQQEVAFLNQFMKDMEKSKAESATDTVKMSAPGTNKAQFTIEHVVIYSSLSKCRIWPKVLKSGIGFVPTLIHFYNSFTKQYGDLLDFKFDPVILSQKYTKIMKNINMKKRDHPKLIDAIKRDDREAIKEIIGKLEEECKAKRGIDEGSNEDEKEECSISTIINNIAHKGLAISQICCQHSSLETIKYLHELGTDFQILDVEKQTALFYAVKRSQIAIVKYLIEVVKVNLNHREYQNRTALYLAAFEGDLEVVDYLHKMGGDAQLPSKLDRTPLSKACYLGNVKVVKYLLSINVDMLKQDNKGRTALHNAVWGVEGGRDGKRRGHIMLEDSPECAELLIQAGHPVDFEDYDGFTPFFSAVSSRAIRSMRLLIAHKANIHHKTKNQQTAVFIAAKYGHLEPIKILIEEYNLSYTEPDYHGYSPLCASITLESPEVLLYFCSLYMRNGVSIGMDKLIECCRQYETTQNIGYLRQWLLEETSPGDRAKRVAYLASHLDSLINNMKKLKKEKKKLKAQIEQVSRKKSSYYKQPLEKQKQKQMIKSQLQVRLQEHGYRKFQQLLSKQQEQQTQDHQTVSPSKQPISPTQKQRQASKEILSLNSLLASMTKQLQLIRKLFDRILQLCAEIVVDLGIQGEEQGKDVKGVAVYLLAELVHVFNKGKQSELVDVVQYMLDLARIIKPVQPTIPPILPHQQPQQQSLSQECIKQSKQSQIPLQQLCLLKVCAHQSESQLIKLLLSPEVRTNLTMDCNSMTDTLFRLARYRKTAVIIALFNYRGRIGAFGYDQLLDIVMGKYLQQREMKEGETGNKLNLIQYCILHGIADIAVFLQQLCKSPETQVLVNIPQYEISRTELSAQECNIDLQAVEEWVFDPAAILSRMGEKEREIYQEYLKDSSQSLQQQQQGQVKASSPHSFHSCKNYQVISTQSQLHKAQQSLQNCLLIGIDVQHYNISKQEYFICSIQIFGGNSVFIIDTLSHLYAQDQQVEDDRLDPTIIGHFMRKLMADQGKVKIFHAYENDVKWLHEDFNLSSNVMGEMLKEHRNVNVVDTSKIYNLCNRVKKGESVGLRTLCKQYLNYEMDKNFQRSDWRIRPLFKQMVQYAATDAEVLPYVFLAMLSHSQKIKVIDKIKQGFCFKTNMKSRGVRNTLVQSKGQSMKKQMISA